MKLNMNSFYGQSIRKDIDEEKIKRSANWLVKKTMGELLKMNPYQMVNMLLKTNHTLEKIKQKRLKKVCHLI